MSSQPELIAQLREARPSAPPELRERIRLVAAQAPPPRRAVTWRRALVVLVPVALAGALAVAFLPRDGGRPAAVDQPLASEKSAGTDLQDSGAAATAPAAAPGGGRLAPAVPPPAGNRAQRYSATLELRVPNANAISKGTTRALQIVASLGGYPQTVRVDAREEEGSAHLVLRVPRNRVEDAVRRLGALGTIVGENVAIQDLQTGVDATARTIARLRTRLTELRVQPQTDEVQGRIAALTAQIERKERGRAATLRSAALATVELELHTPAAATPADDGDGPLHGLGVAFRWIGIGAVYALALGGPALALLALGWLLARRVGRRREERLLSRS